MKYNETEQETIGLCIVLEAINSIANHALLDVKPISESPGEAIVYFKTHIHRDLFLVRVLDFSKEKGSPSLIGSKGSSLGVLESVCDSPNFNEDDSIDFLKAPVIAFKEWIHKEKTVKLWLPSLDLDASISVSRIELLTISGNSSKHNISRLTGVCGIIEGILERNGYTVDLEQIPLALDDFREHLQENYFIYYGTQITELINNLRWGIQLYLHPAFLRANKWEEDRNKGYTYIYPSAIENEIPKQWFWRLMNNVRSDPYIKKFRCWSCLNEESSLETIDNP